MKIVILTVHHVYSNKLVKDLIEAFPGEINLIIEPTEQLRNKTNFQAVLYYIKTAGLAYVFFQTTKLIIYRFLANISPFFSKDPTNKFYSYHELAKSKNIPVLKLPDINSNEASRVLKKYKPDIIASVLFSQIIKPSVIALAKKKVINIHPAHLPDYKGISPIFWALLNGEKTSGISVHLINEGIDTGKIICRKKVKILDTDTEDALYWRCVDKGSLLLINSINKIRKGRLKTLANKGGRYFSFPTKSAVKKYLAQGRNFYNLFDYVLG